MLQKRARWRATPSEGRHAGPTLKNVAGITSFERKFKSALEATPFGCYPSMLLDVYEGNVGWSETDMRGVFLAISPINCLLAPAAGTVFARLTPKFRPLAV